MNPGTIRARLLAAMVLVVLVAAGVAAVGMWVVLRAERDLRTLAHERIPAVALAGELAEVTGDLAALAVRVVAEPGLTGTELADAVAEAEAGIAIILAAAPGGTPLRETVGSAQAALTAALLDFSATGEGLARLAQAEAAADSQLRWTHSDVQDQAQGLLRDLSFNMDAQLAVLVGDSDAARRAEAEGVLGRDRQLRDRLQQLAAEAATLTALLLQARSAPNLAALDQVERLGHDTLDALALARMYLPVRTDIALFLQGVDQLKDLAAGPASIFAQSRARLDLRTAAVADLARAQAALAGMQAELTALGRAERIGAQTAADRASGVIFRGSVALSVITLLGVVVTGVILYFFVNTRILRRIEALSDDLTRIARGDLGGPSRDPGTDEIGEMARAVEVFRTSVREREQTMARLKLTQRELVQAGKMAALGQMSAAISHEINQPLAAMRHRLHNLAQAHPQARDGIGRIEAMVERITATIGHLRRIARRAEHRRMQITLSEPLEAALALLDHRLRAERVTVLRLPGLADHRVAGDEILLEQVLLNVLGNALDAIAATGRGHGTVRITAGEGDPLVLTIADDGVGLGGQSGAALIDPFFTTKEPGKGLGLGLSIAFNVMQDMGGNLEIAAAEGGGAEVRLRLARWPQPVAAREAADG